MKITNVTVRDVHFPTSRQQDGSDALTQGDYSAASVVLDTAAGLQGHGLTFTKRRVAQCGLGSMGAAATASR
jgi:L-fuconate dehydratase